MSMNLNPAATWRAVATFATLGWAATVMAWWSTAAAVSVAEPAAMADEPRSRRARAASPRRSPQRPRSTAPAAVPPVDEAWHDALREEVRREVLAELEEERAERRQARSEHHLARMLDHAAAFATDHELDGAVEAELVTALSTLHERMEALRPEGPPPAEGPPPEVEEERRAAWDDLHDDALQALDDPDLAAEFVDWVPAPGPPGPPTDRPR